MAEGAGEAAAVASASHHEDDGDHRDGDAAAVSSSGPLVYSLSDLPKELVQLIAEKLHCHVDLQHFGSTCKALHSVIVENHKRLPHHLPLYHCLHEKLRLPVLMRSHNNEELVMEFVSLPGGEVYGEFHLPEIGKKKLIGSSRGWLVTVDNHDEVYLLNPLTRAEMQLPPFSRSPVSFVSVRKVVLSSEPKLSRTGCVAMAMFFGGFHFCQLGGDGWTIVKDHHLLVQDAIYYKGRSYVAGFNGLVGVVDEIGPDAKVKIVADVTESNFHPSPSRIYLVESSGGKLLLVVRVVDREDDEEVVDSSDICAFKTTGFVVFRLECAELYVEQELFSNPKHGPTNEWGKVHEWIDRGWVRVESLDGDMLFLDKNSSMAIPSHLHWEGKANCIYFTEDYLYYDPQLRVSDQGIYDMESRRIVPYAPPDDRCVSMPLVWVTPNPW